jgi:2-phosphoxylose phosphatase
VNLLTVDVDHDDMYPNPDICPRLNELTKQLHESKDYQQHYESVTAPLLAKLGAALGTTNMTIETASNVFDCVHTHVCHNFSLPPALNTELVDALEKEAAWQQYAQYNFPNHTYFGRLAMGPLISEVYSGMQQVLSEPDPLKQQKFRLFSGHDTTIMPFLAAFQVANGEWAPYASMVVLELYDTPDGGHAVQFIYNGDILHLPGCSNVLCDYTEFQTIVSGLIPRAGDCDHKKTVKTHHSKADLLQAIFSSSPPM